MQPHNPHLYNAKIEGVAFPFGNSQSLELQSVTPSAVVELHIQNPTYGIMIKKYTGEPSQGHLVMLLPQTNDHSWLAIMATPT